MMPPSARQMITPFLFVIGFIMLFVFMNAYLQYCYKSCICDRFRSFGNSGANTGVLGAKILPHLSILAPHLSHLIPSPQPDLAPLKNSLTPHLHPAWLSKNWINEKTTWPTSILGVKKNYPRASIDLVPQQTCPWLRACRVISPSRWRCSCTGQGWEASSRVGQRSTPGREHRNTNRTGSPTTI